MERKTMNIPDAAKALGISRPQAYKMAREGVLPVLRLGKRIVVPITALDNLLNSTTETNIKKHG